MTPGRSCPVEYRYDPASLNRPADFSADTLYVIGGLYGNRPALQAIEALAAAESGNLASFESLADALRRPFHPLPTDAPFREPAPAEFCGYRTFCGT